MSLRRLSKGATVTVANRVLNSVSFFVQLIFLVSILRLCFSGLDFTDEGKYLNDSTLPSQSTDLVTHYGYVYHPMFRTLDFNIPAFRVANLLITFILASIASYRSLKKFSALSGLSNLSVSISVGLISLSFLSVYWLSTPSYNTLTLQSLMLCWIFFLNYMDQSDEKLQILNSLCFASSCVLLFLAKPSSFLLLHLVTFLFVIKYMGIKAGFMKIATHIAIVTSILFSFSTVIYGSPVEILFRVFNGYQNLKLLTKDSYTLVGILQNAKISDQTLVSLSIVLFSLVVIKFRCLFPRARIQRKTRIFFAIIFLLSICLLMLYFTETSNLSMFLLLIPISLAYIWTCSFSREYTPNEKVGYLYFLILLPLIGAAGTTNNLFIQYQFFFFFVILFSILTISKRGNPRNSDLILKSFAICLVCLTAVVLYVAANSPYRQVSSLFSNSFRFSDNPTVRNLLVDYNTSNSYSKMSTVVLDSGFKPGEGLIDLTGQSPAVSFLIGAKPLGDSWLLGGYSGSNEFAIKKLMPLSCKEKISSYLLVEPDGPLSLNEAYVLKRIGLDYTKYLNAGNWIAPRGAGGYVEERILFLLKPNYSESYCN